MTIAFVLWKKRKLGHFVGVSGGIIIGVLVRVHHIAALRNSLVLRIVENIAWIALALMVVVILLQVIFRYLLNNALPWSDEAARFLILWMTGLIAPVAYPTLQGFIRHHLNPQKAYVRWSKQDVNLAPALWLGAVDFVLFEELTGSVSVSRKFGKPDRVSSGLRVD